VARLRQAAHYADLGMQTIIGAAYAGVSEIEIFSQARAVQMKIITETEFDPLNTSLLTAAWPARPGTQPHGVPRIADRLDEGPHIALSFMRVKGYGAECERSFFVSPPTAEMKEKFRLMQEARRRAFASSGPERPAPKSTRRQMASWGQRATAPTCCTGLGRALDWATTKAHGWPKAARISWRKIC
jgi:Xaa-Pro dipeptidase